MSKGTSLPVETSGKSFEVLEGDGKTVALVVSGAIVYHLPVSEALQLVEGLLVEVRRINGPAFEERSEVDLNQTELFPSLAAGGAL